MYQISPWRYQFPAAASPCWYMVYQCVYHLGGILSCQDGIILAVSLIYCEYHLYGISYIGTDGITLAVSIIYAVYHLGGIGIYA